MKNNRKSTIQRYQYSLDATYRFMVKNHGEQTLVPQETKVLVIGEGPRSYKVRLLSPIKDHLVGDEILVHKKSLVFHTPNPNHPSQEHWWDNM